jgi:hypothetical protein
MSRITKREVDGAEPGDRIRFVWDDTLPGFGLVVRPTGRKAYVVQYRNAQKRTRRLVLGSHGVLTPDQARRLAAAKLAAAYCVASAGVHEIRAGGPVRFRAIEGDGSWEGHDGLRPRAA